MRILLLFLFLAYPMLELALMIKIGSVIGGWRLLGVVCVTGMVGMLALRQHGLTMLRRMSEAMAEGRPPLVDALHGALVGAAGLLLIAPGLITDAVGLVLLLPPVRWLLIRWVQRTSLFGSGDAFAEPGAAKRSDETERGPFTRTSDPFNRKRPAKRDPIVIDGEFERLDDRAIDPSKRSGDPNRRGNGTDKPS